MTSISVRNQSSAFGARTAPGPLRVPSRADRATSVAAVTAVGAAVPVTVLHLAATRPMEPTAWTISDYVVGVKDGIALYGITAGLLGIGGAALAAALHTRPGTALIRLLLMVWAVAVVLTAAFPTNLRGTQETVSSTVHLIAGAVVFAVLPAVGWMLSRSQDAARPCWLRWTSLVAGALSAALIANRLPGVVGMPQPMLPPGLLQRAAGALLILLLAVIALTLRKSRAGSHIGSGTGTGTG
jgi:hypothetical protein